MEYKAKIQISEKLINDIFPSVQAKKGREIKDKNIIGFVYTFNKYADYFAIDTPLEVRHFIAQVAHESDHFNAYEEYASGSGYENRKDLGNNFKGDGIKFKGRGPIQITGRSNYKKMGEEIAKLPFLTDLERKIFQNDGLLKDPAKLQDPVWGTLAAFIFWVNKDLNSLCLPDNQKVTIKRLNTSGWYNYTCSPIEAITRKINGGINGFDERIKNYEALKKVI